LAIEYSAPFNSLYDTPNLENLQPSEFEKTQTKYSVPFDEPSEVPFVLFRHTMSGSFVPIRVEVDYP
jgi:hypothetical protein